MTNVDELTATGSAMLSATLHGRHVLVVEDSGLLWGMLDETLRDACCLVVGPYTRVDQAMAALPAIRTIDVALLDIDLRGELVRPLAGELMQRGVPILVTSAYRRSELSPTLQSAAFLRKPFTGCDLLDGLAALLEHSPGARTPDC